MTRQSLIRHRADLLRRGLLFASITAGAAMWAVAMLRVAGYDVVSVTEVDAMLGSVAQRL